jgi:tRNA pseudouridine55 synthase
MDGLLIVDKPVGPTSHAVVSRVRRALGERRIGHTGTLDPIASGVLPLVLGRATRLARFLSGASKAYDAAIRLGVSTTTYDAEGTPVGPVYQGPLPPLARIDGVLDEFRGTFLQQPPIYSAKKIAGRRSYEMARAAGNGRAGDAEQVRPGAVSVTAHAIAVTALEGDVVRLRVECGAGFYVRSLAHDMGERLGIGAHLAALRRTASGDLTLDRAVPLDAIERQPALGAEAIVPLAGMLPHVSAVTLTGEGVRRAVHGRDLGPADVDREKGVGSLFFESLRKTTPDPFFRLLDPDGNLVGIASVEDISGLLHPAVVLV